MTDQQALDLAEGGTHFCGWAAAIFFGMLGVTGHPLAAGAAMVSALLTLYCVVSACRYGNRTHSHSDERPYG